MIPTTVEATAALLAGQRYIADRELATTIHLALTMQRPLFLEGEPGTGKTEIAKVLAAGLGRRLVRLQCYDGLDIAGAAYEWDHARQLMAIRLAEAAGAANQVATDIYGREYLLSRPLFSAIDPALPPGGAADRRARPRRRALRGLPPRAAGRLPDLHPRVRHRPRADAPGGDHDLEPHPRGA